MTMKLDRAYLNEQFPNPANYRKSKYQNGCDGREGITLTWSDLSVTVKQIKKSFFKPNTVTYKKIVNNVSGAVENGKLVALMGPSGAGKSTILYALAHRHSGQMMVDGDVKINGRQVNESMCRISGFMRQEDIFIGDLTVKEHLIFMACLKLDKRISYQEKESRVSYLINELGLEHCRNRKIGGSMFGDKTELSGGERKRLSFATACLSNPALLFCDEPTSGLDSLNAIRIISMMASWNATILCTIHQPSPEVLKCFSSIMLVADGSLVFSGSVDDALDFFRSAGYHMNVNEGAGEFLMSCLAPPPGSVLSAKMTVKKLAHQFVLSEYSKTTELLIALQEQPIKVNEMTQTLFDHKSSSWFYKFYYILYRSILEVLRNPQLQWLKIAQKIVVAIAAGLCYVGAVNNDQAGVQAVQGALFILITENTFPALYSALALIPKELPLLVREVRDGDYHPSALYLAKIISHLPGLALDAFIFTAIIYLLASLRPTTFAFSMVSLISILCILVSTACGLMFASVFENYEQASVFLIPFDNTMMIISGLFIKLSTLPLVVSWLQYLSWMRYCYESLSIIQWQDVDDISCDTSTYLPCLRSGSEIFEYYSFTEEHLYWNITFLVILYLCFNIIGYIFFVKKIKKHF
ncbi:protein scarlet [Halyomorpha halys]|uniref:protein scarlet n=1 Tax=Halyomorpha halys TaxID=286706 RepID=UPI0006D51E02